jgi:deoxyribodipyrimidine photolyase
VRFPSQGNFVNNTNFPNTCGARYRCRTLLPYFNPDSQLKKFDPKFEGIKKWVPEYADFSKYPKPIIDHSFARERCLKAFIAAVSK